MVLRLYLGARIRIRIKVKGRVRIRTRINVTKPYNILRLIFILLNFSIGKERAEKSGWYSTQLVRYRISTI
jgi:hypothetical protein